MDDAGFGAAMDQERERLRTLTVLLAAYFEVLRANGFSRSEALALVIEERRELGRNERGPNQGGGD